MAATLCLLAYLSVIANVAFPALRLASSIANFVIFAAAQLLLIPILAWVARWLRARGTALRSPRAITSGLLAFLAYLSGLFALFVVAPPLVSEPFATISTPRGRVVAYPTISGGVTFRQECGLAPGILLVRDLGADHPAFEVSLSADGQTVRAVLPENFSRHEATHQFRPVKLPCRFSAG